MKILAIVILYYPDLDVLRENLEAFMRHVETTMIWDNSPKEISAMNEKHVKSFLSNVLFQGNGHNLGISSGLNKAWEYAKHNQYDVLLTMDQDSLFCDFESYLQRVLGFWKSEGLCACGPTPNLNRNIVLGEFNQEPHLITSGMLIPVSLLNDCGGYCQDFKIDGIDIELCYKLKEYGYKSYIDNKSNLIQRFGQQEKRKLPILGEKTFSNYNKDRLYGIFRNHIIVWRRYHYPRRLAKLIFYEYFTTYVIKDVFFGKGKREKLRAVFKGIIDGFRFPM